MQHEAYDYLEKLLNWRKGQKVIHQGQMKQFIPEDGVYVFFRYNDQESVMVILNNNEHGGTKLELGRFKESLGNSKKGREVISGRKISLNEVLEIGPKSAMIIELVN